MYQICRRVTKDLDGDGEPDQFGITGYTYEDAFGSNNVTLFNEKGTECYFTGDEEIQSEIFTYSEGVSVLRDVTESEQTLVQLLADPGSGSFQIETLSSAVEHAAVSPHFNGYEDAMKEVEEAVTNILEGDANISTGQIIWNRKINADLKEKNIK